MNTEKQVIKNINSLIQKVSPLRYVLDRLEKTGIRYGLYAGSHVAILTNNRPPTDIDFIVHDDDLNVLKATFPFAKTRDLGHGVFLYVGDDDVIEFMGAADIFKEGTLYPFRLTELAAQRVTTYSGALSRIKVVDPVDTLLLKALLRRGKNQGKHDFEDIEAILAHVQLDKTYLQTRLGETNSTKVTRGTWQRFGIEV